MSPKQQKAPQAEREVRYGVWLTGTGHDHIACSLSTSGGGGRRIKVQVSLWLQVEVQASLVKLRHCLMEKQKQVRHGGTRISSWEAGEFLYILRQPGLHSDPGQLGIQTKNNCFGAMAMKLFNLPTLPSPHAENPNFLLLFSLSQILART